HEVAAAQDVAQHKTPRLRPADDRRHARRGGAREAKLASEEAGKPPSLAVSLSPAARRCERDNRPSAPALGEFESQSASHRIPDNVRSADPEFVEVALE